MPFTLPRESGFTSFVRRLGNSPSHAPSQAETSSKLPEPEDVIDNKWNVLTHEGGRSPVRHYWPPPPECQDASPPESFRTSSIEKSTYDASMWLVIQNLFSSTQLVPFLFLPSPSITASGSRTRIFKGKPTAGEKNTKAQKANPPSLMTSISSQYAYPNPCLSIQGSRPPDHLARRSKADQHRAPCSHDVPASSPHEVTTSVCSHSPGRPICMHDSGCGLSPRATSSHTPFFARVHGSACPPHSDCANQRSSECTSTDCDSLNTPVLPPLNFSPPLSVHFPASQNSVLKQKPQPDHDSHLRSQTLLENSKKYGPRTSSAKKTSERSADLGPPVTRKTKSTTFKKHISSIHHDPDWQSRVIILPSDISALLDEPYSLANETVDDWLFSSS